MNLPTRRISQLNSRLLCSKVTKHNTFGVKCRGNYEPCVTALFCKSPFLSCHGGIIGRGRTSSICFAYPVILFLLLHPHTPRSRPSNSRLSGVLHHSTVQAVKYHNRQAEFSVQQPFRGVLPSQKEMFFFAVFPQARAYHNLEATSIPWLAT